MAAADVLRAPQQARRLAAHLRTPLHRDAYALVFNSAFTAALGLIYWIVAAKAYDAHAVGVNSALISSMMFLAGLACLDLPNVLIRFLPDAGERAARIVRWCYLLTGTIALIAASVFLLGIDAWAPKLAFLNSTPALTGWFVLATIVWVVFVIQDGVLTAFGRAVWVPAENAVFSVLKLVLLAVLAGAMPMYGIFVSWTVGVLVAVIGVNIAIFTRVAKQRRPRAATEPALNPRDPAMVRFFAADYAGALGWLASVNLMPVVVTATAGATTNAHFALPWAVAFPLYAVAANVGASLLLHGASNRAQLPVLVRRATRQALWVLLPSIVVLGVFAPQILMLFGDEYADHGVTLMRLLLLGALPNLLLALAMNVARIEQRMAVAVTALWTQAIIALGLVVPLIHMWDVTGAGIAWLTSQTVVALGLVVHGRTRTHAGRVRSAKLRARAAEGLSGAWMRRARGAAAAAEPLAELARTRPDVLPAGFSTYAAPTDSDTVVVFARAEGRTRAVVKLAWTPAGAVALAAQTDAIAAVRALEGLGDWRTLLPEELDRGTVDGRPYVVEQALQGVDGRHLAAAGPDALRDAVTAAARGMAPLYAATALDRVVDARLLDTLVARPFATLATAYGRGAGPALDRLREDLSASIAGRVVRLGRVHGDLWLGNVLLDERASRLTGVVDWEASRAEDVPGADIAHLIVAARSHRDARSFGDVVRNRLAAGTLEAWEEELLAPYADPATGGLEVRSLLVLAWLQHAVARLEQSSFHSPRRWLRRNVDPVLLAAER